VAPGRDPVEFAALCAGRRPPVVDERGVVGHAAAGRVLAGPGLHVLGDREVLGQARPPVGLLRGAAARRAGRGSAGAPPCTPLRPRRGLVTCTTGGARVGPGRATRPRIGGPIGYPIASRFGFRWVFLLAVA